MGALMISLDCHHPDLIDFINIKANDDCVTKANISARVTDDFMRAVEEDKDWVMSFTRPETGEVITRTEKARDIFDLICKNNWDYAEPGILFWDNICNWNLLSENPNFEYAGTNPCAEEPLPAGGSCLLGSINLAEFVINPFTSDADFDVNAFSRTVFDAVYGLNEVLEEGLPLHPLQEQRDSVNKWKQIGLGVMGIADMLIKMGLKYSSEEARVLCDEIGTILSNTAIGASAMLASEKGSYDEFNYEQLIQTPYYSENVWGQSETQELVEAYGLRNSQLLTIAPTGTLSTMLGISGGIEPIFANSYTRRTESLTNQTEYYKIYTPIVEQYMKLAGIVDEEDLPDYFQTSADIAPIDRVLMQSTWQSHIDASISSTVNLPVEATVEDVKTIYMEAWKHGLKGITVFRNGCKRAGVLTLDGENDEQANNEPEIPWGTVIACSDDLVGKKRKLQTGCGSLHVLAFFEPYTGELQEVYLSKGSTGGCQNFMIGLSRTISLLARAGVDIDTIVDQLNSTGVCPSYATRKATHGDTSKGSCCPMAIGNAIKAMCEEMHSELFEEEGDINTIPIKETTITENNNNTDACPQCGEPLVREGGCIQCKSCGWSKCD